MVDAALRNLVEPDFDDDGPELIVAAVAAPDAEVHEGLSVEGVTFDEFQDYRGATFLGPVLLRDVRFQRGFSFEGAKFHGKVRFYGVTNGRTGGSVANFNGAEFRQSVTFNRRTALYRADFQNARFGDQAKFHGCRFYAAARFDKAVFGHPANFKSAIFNGAGHFNGARFESSAEFEEVEFRYRHAHARFGSCHFAGPSDFNGGRFCGSVDFTEAVFFQGANFHGSRFDLRQTEADADEESASTQEASERADIVVCFASATFHADEDGQVANFENAKFGDRNFHREITFDRAYFRPSIGPSPRDPCVNFKRAHFLGATSFGEAQFAPSVAAEFSHSQFENKLDLRDCQFGGRVTFEKSQFTHDVILAQAAFRDYPDFRQATFTHVPELALARLPEKLQGLSRKTKKSLVPRISFLRHMASRTNDKKTEFDLLVRELKLEGGFASRLYGLVCNFGQSWARPALWLAVLTLILFPLLHLAANGRLPTIDPLGGEIAGALACADGSGGSPIAAALELSVKNALIVAPENEMQNRRITDCLGAPPISGSRSIASAVLQAAQIITTLVMIFFIGGAIRRRLQMR